MIVSSSNTAISGIDNVRIDYTCNFLNVACAAQIEVHVDSECRGTMPDLSQYLTVASSCDTIASLTQSVSVNSMHNSGSVMVNVTATDNAQNSATCAIQVNVSIISKS